jgi:type IV pilus assembly protein PilY1
MKSLPFDRTARRGLAKRLIAGAALAAGAAMPPHAMAALTEIANAPIASAATTTVPPNVLFILDASGSMGSDYMPDDASSFRGEIGGKNHLCNTIYYNPAVSYLPPKNADGSDFPNSSFTAARTNGFDAASSTTNLSVAFKVNGDSGTITDLAYYYRWDGAGTPGSSDCNDDDQTGAHTIPGKWTKVFIGPAEQQNFANWYTYYRTRMLLMKTAAGRAFNGLNDTFRVGFITICPNGSSCDNDTQVTPVTSGYYLKIDAFTPSHKAAWYAKFYQQAPSSYTPLRQALARAGRHFAGLKDGINSGMNDDPVQYSCQQNFSILTTDGYWNYGRGKTLFNGTSGSGDIGDNDNNSGLTPRPMYDGGPVNTVLVERREEARGGSSSPSCSGQQKTRLVERVTTTPQFGSTTQTTSTISNTCEPAGVPLPTPWVVVSGPTTSAAGSTANTLADVAEYYYRTDLRGPGSIGALGTDVGTNNNVPSSGSGVEDDKANWQHMTTFTLGLGLDGQLKFDPNYKSQTVGDFADLRTGAKGWPNPNPGNPGGPSTNERMARIDDLWHAAVNGRGQYFSAKDPTSLALSLQTALTAIQTRLASAAAAATSTLEPTSADNLIVLPTYVTNEWTGELKAFQIDVTPGSPTFGQLIPTLLWSAQAKLDAKTQAACDDRRIKLFRAGAPDNLVDFTFGTVSCASGALPDGLDPTTEKVYFTAGGAADEVQDLSQWSLMTDGTSGTVDQKTAARGANLVNFLRGQRGKEGFVPNDLNKLYRARKHILGDIVNSQPLYVRGAAFSYTDTGYSSFISSVASRTPMVYAAANDGMVHAFYGTTDALGGEEAWAFIPRAVLPRLYKLADNNYANLHEYYVDGRPVRDDVFDKTSGTWKTILVGGLNKGGRGYYALDITNPTTPRALWEFTHSPTTCAGAGQFSDCHLGYTFGNPVITKLAPDAAYPEGRWVVLVASGYNNVNAPTQTGDGQGYLYVLDAITGEILYKIRAGDGTATFGDASNPSGLAKITAWVNDSEKNNRTLRVYGVDLLGNVWRFDINDERNIFGDPILPPAGREATLLATLKDPSGKPQPITVAPRLAEVGSPPEPFLFVGTGRYLGVSDVTDTQAHSVYAIRDPLTPATPPSSVYANLRDSLNEIVLTNVGTDRFVNCNPATPAACKSADGWFADFIDPGERVNVPMELQLGTLVVASNVPANTACEPGGYSYLNFFDITSGFSPAGTTQRSGYRTAGLTVGLSIVRLPDGTVQVFRQRSDPPCDSCIEIGAVPIPSGAPLGKRSTWREISQ